MPKPLKIAALAVLTIVTIAVVAGLFSNTQLAVAGGVGEGDGFGGRASAERAVWTEENGSVTRVLELKVDAEPVRPLKPRPGVYIYETPLLPLSDGGFVFERWVFNVTCSGDVCNITRIHYFYLIEGDRRRESLPIVDIFLVKNNTLINLRAETGNWTYILNEVVPPNSKHTMCIFMFPRFFTYVEPGKRFTVTLTYNGTFLQPKFLGAGHTWSILGTIRETFQVEKNTVKCNGPTGLCYVVKTRAVENYRSVLRYEDGREDWDQNQTVDEYVWYIDTSGVVVKVERRGVAPQPTHPVVLYLVEWK